MAQFNRWSVLKLIEVILVLVCLTFKRVTDDEASRVFLYLQKVSREWSLLNNITWSKVGAAAADVTYGGYLIITGALFLGHIVGELPTTKRVTEYVFLGIGIILFTVMGSLSFAALDSVPESLVDNAAIVGTFSLIVAGLFLLDLAGPKKRHTKPQQPKQQKKRSIVPPDSITKQVYEVEKSKQKVQKEKKEVLKPLEMQFQPKMTDRSVKVEKEKNGRNGIAVMEMQTTNSSNKGYQRMRDDSLRKYPTYGEDVGDDGSTEAEEMELPPQMSDHSPVWSNIRKGEYGKYDILNPKYILRRPDRLHEEIRPPNSPGDPGYVQYTAQHWGEYGSRTPRPSPTQLTPV
ncbi:uncharacterized protein LOC114339015 [Diabrotica virgifera virgifera]|uniref:Uncharacterized protein n=1 Tax=Diabrotica virgifera virgifera TaxID=50390 RepID=A0ABM5IWJ7_DIAVI|nr:uncharacterized protein LOC114339015 [Diabrotica virgifera virgifera]